MEKIIYKCIDCHSEIDYKQRSRYGKLSGWKFANLYCCNCPCIPRYIEIRYKVQDDSMERQSWLIDEFFLRRDLIEYSPYLYNLIYDK